MNTTEKKSEWPESAIGSCWPSLTKVKSMVQDARPATSLKYRESSWEGRSWERESDWMAELARRQNTESDSKEENFYRSRSVRPGNRKRLCGNMEPLRRHLSKRIVLSICPKYPNRSESEYRMLELSKTNASSFQNVHSITNCPWSPNVCPIFGKISSHSCVHSFELSDHRPVHSDFPHGIRWIPNNNQSLLFTFYQHFTARWTKFGKRPRTSLLDKELNC